MGDYTAHNRKSFKLSCGLSDRPAAASFRHDCRVSNRFFSPRTSLQTGSGPERRVTIEAVSFVLTHRPPQCFDNHMIPIFLGLHPVLRRLAPPNDHIDKGHERSLCETQGLDIRHSLAYMTCTPEDRDLLDRANGEAMGQIPDTKPPAWGFYGREKKLEELSGYLHIHPLNDRSFFSCTAITGRRGVGKNALLDECMTIYDKPDRLILFELPGNRTPAGANSIGGRWPYDAEVLEAIQMEMSTLGITWLLDDMPENWRVSRPSTLICRIIEHLVNKDYIVALDEVHNCGDQSHLPGDLKKLIDRLSRTKNSVLCATGQPPPTGHLVLMGSHQQKFQKMRRGDQPLAGRIHATAHLRPWRMETILNVARRHRWDRRPRRLLTLWTAFGGLPREWERFALLAGSDDHLAHGWPPLTGHHARDYRDDQAWHREFVAHAERHLRGDAEQRWDNAAFIHLPEETAEILCLMGIDISAVKMQSPLDIHERMDPELVLPVRTIRKELKYFMDYLDVVGSQDMYTGPSGDERLWYMKDNTTLFQLALAPDLFQSARRAKRDRQEPMPDPSESVANLEGVMLERWISAMLAYHPRVRMNVGSAKPLDDGQADIDGLVRLANEPVKGVQAHDRSHDLLLCINAKRRGRDHKPDKFCKIVQEFMDPKINPDPDVDAIRRLARRHLFVSPHLNPSHKQAIRAAGHLALDMPDLIRELHEGWPLVNQVLAEARRPLPPVATTRTVPPTKPDGPS